MEMENFENRISNNINKKILDVDRVERNQAGEIIKIYGEILRDEGEVIEEGTRLDAESLNQVVNYLAEQKVYDTLKAIEDTIEDSDKLQGIIMDISPSANLDELFRPLENYRTKGFFLGKEKAKLKRIKRHSSWLRIYAIRLSEGVYVITGGAIKLTLKMEEREHTRQELVKLEQVREFLLSENIIDDDSFVEYMNML